MALLCNFCVISQGRCCTARLSPESPLSALCLDHQQVTISVSNTQYKLPDGSDAAHGINKPCFTCPQIKYKTPLLSTAPDILPSLPLPHHTTSQHQHQPQAHIKPFNKFRIITETAFEMSSFSMQVGNKMVASRPWTGGPYYRVPVNNGTYPTQNIRLPVDGTSWTPLQPYTYQTFVPVTIAPAPVQYVPCVLVQPQPEPTIWYQTVGDSP